MTDCLSLVNPQISEIIWCAIDTAAGGFGAILFFLVFVYGLYKIKVPFIPAMALSLMMIIAFAGMNMMPPLFANLVNIAILLLAVIIVLAFWRLRG